MAASFSSFYVIICHLYFLFSEMSLHIFCPFSIWIFLSVYLFFFFFFFCCWVFKVSYIFWIQVFHLFWVQVLYAFWIQKLANIFSPSVTVFIFITGSFIKWSFKFDKVQLNIFSLNTYGTLWLTLDHEDFLLYFLASVMVSCLIFKPRVRFELIFYKVGSLDGRSCFTSGWPIVCCCCLVSLMACGSSQTRDPIWAAAANYAIAGATPGP